MSIRFPVADPRLNSQSVANVDECVRSHWISSSGRYLLEFETEFAKIFGPGHAVSVSNGTIAIELALIALGIGPGDEVIVPNFTFVGSVSPIYRVHATPVLVQPTAEGWNLDPEDVRRHIGPKTKAVIAVHLYGHPCDIVAIKTLCDEHGLFLIEDCAEALGAQVNGQNIGTFGDVGCYSFFGNKVLTTGEGGMCLSTKPEVAEQIYIYKNHGMRADERYWHRVIGYNGRLTNLQAAVGLGQLSTIQSDMDRRWAIYERYNKTLNASPFFRNIPLPQGAKAVNWLQSPVLDKNSGLDRDDLLRQLKTKGIDSRPFFYPISCMPAFSRFGFHDARSHDMAAHGFNLPTYIQLQDEEVDEIAQAVVDICTEMHKNNGSQSFDLRLPSDPRLQSNVNISIILPTKNAGRELIAVVSEARRQMVSISQNAEFLIVDDHSYDGSIENLQELFRQDPSVKVLQRQGLPSFGSAIWEGLQASQGQRLIIMDANGNHDPKILGTMVKNSEVYDMVSGSRFTSGGKCQDKFKHFCSHNFNRAIRLILGIPSRDNTSGYLCIRKDKLLQLEPQSALAQGPNYFFHLMVRAHQKNMSMLEIPTISRQKFPWPLTQHHLERCQNYFISAVRLGLKRFL
jgi:perosamine synthetase